ncbi:MAG TPA: sigma-54 dependent transcriptional regulator [Candidatus Polarisedimenticolaceae bacterium]|nr:sigma-54 dependent transcriptional regulator [Candidatus Polarisedimenticolaceae bacterium]
MPEFLTKSAAYLETLRIAERAAGSSASVLIVGETGTGKNRLARFLHNRGPRASEPFVEVACANVPPELFESELFGHEAGAFTDARATRVGRLEQAHRGTLFLDDLQELDIVAQPKFLRAIEERRFERVGGSSTIEVDVRMVASAREHPARLVESGRLREDLLYRLDVIRIELPPLRARVDDVPILAEALLREVAERHGLPEKRFAPEALERLRAYPWPGNVRELRHVVEASVVLSTGPEILPSDLPEALSVGAPAFLRDAAAKGASLADVERAYIAEVLHRVRGNKSAAARVLGIHRKTLHEKLRGNDGAPDRE